ncbi:hypothetical protein JW905_18870 [bacterium]|nr:hypothetical protein [candidate division CSSED10-310 bacterium]
MQRISSRIPAGTDSVAGPSRSFNQVLGAERNGLRPDRGPEGTLSNACVRTLHEVLDAVVHGQAQVSRIVDLALNGKTFSQQELLVLQTGMYSFIQELELTSKVVEQVTNGIKTTMQTQV